MRDIKNINIWKEEEKTDNSNAIFLNTSIEDLNLSVRSFNCLKRAGCNTIGDVLECMGEEGTGLRRIRNLGNRSETEILEKIEEQRTLCKEQGDTNFSKKVTIIRPAKRIWDREIDEFPISGYAAKRFKECGINKVGDLYIKGMPKDPGWCVVRELFGVIPSSR